MTAVTIGGLRERVWTALTENLGLKAFALLASLLIYSLVHGTDEQPQPINVRVRALLPPPSAGRVLVSDVPEEVWITVRGSSSIIQNLKRDDIPPVQVDLRGPPARTFYFERSMFRLPAGVKIVDVEASDVSFAVQWEAMVTRRTAVRVATTGAPNPGTRVEVPIRTVPAAITVAGAESRVARLEDAETEPIDVRGLGVGDYERIVALRPAPPHTEYQHEGPVRATVRIVPDLIERLYTGRPVTAVGGSMRLEVRPATVDVRLRGPREVLADLSGDRLLPFVDGTSVQVGPDQTVRIPPRLEDLPPSVEVVELIPAQVFVQWHRPGARP